MPNQLPQNKSPENQENKPSEKSSNNSPAELFAFLKCPNCKDHTLMQKSKTFFKCHACDYSKQVRLEEKEQSSGDFLSGFSGMVVIAVVLLAFLSILSTEGPTNFVDTTTESSQNSLNSR